ncbi:MULTISPECIES: hypothetical protein [unclassified Bradyrhizobium]|uniref:hypothetical protein n=1 Tax=unclassified Bradyrhizobium TaxID=2631580 RepID=UPI0028EB247F|nr:MULTISPECIES: hypothetical protein [unclassified Bradyrhizobium]
MTRRDQPVLFRCAHSDRHALSNQRATVRIGGHVNPHRQVVLDGGRIDGDQAFDGEPHGAIRVERVVGDAGQLLEFMLMKYEALSARKPMVSQALDHACVAQDHLGKMPKNILQRSGRRLQPMDSVHSASPMIAATK